MENLVKINLSNCSVDINKLRELVEYNEGCILSTDAVKRNSVSIRIRALDNYVKNCSGLVASDIININESLEEANNKFIELVNTTIKLLSEKTEDYRDAENSIQSTFKY